jgi:hypothetical protein
VLNLLASHQDSRALSLLCTPAGSPRDSQACNRLGNLRCSRLCSPLLSRLAHQARNRRAVPADSQQDSLVLAPRSSLSRNRPASPLRSLVFTRRRNQAMLRPSSHQANLPVSPQDSPLLSRARSRRVVPVAVLQVSPAACQLCSQARSPLHSRPASPRSSRAASPVRCLARNPLCSLRSNHRECRRSILALSQVRSHLRSHRSYQVISPRLRQPLSLLALPLLNPQRCRRPSRLAPLLLSLLGYRQSSPAPFHPVSRPQFRLCRQA